MPRLPRSSLVALAFLASPWGVLRLAAQEAPAPPELPFRQEIRWSERIHFHRNAIDPEKFEEDTHVWRGVVVTIDWTRAELGATLRLAGTIVEGSSWDLAPPGRGAPADERRRINGHFAPFPLEVTISGDAVACELDLAKALELEPGARAGADLPPATAQAVRATAGRCLRRALLEAWALHTPRGERPRVVELAYTRVDRDERESFELSLGAAQAWVDRDASVRPVAVEFRGRERERLLPRFGMVVSGRDALDFQRLVVRSGTWETAVAKSVFAETVGLEFEFAARRVSAAAPEAQEDAIAAKSLAPGQRLLLTIDDDLTRETSESVGQSLRSISQWERLGATLLVDVVGAADALRLEALVVEGSFAGGETSTARSSLSSDSARMSLDGVLLDVDTSKPTATVRVEPRSARSIRPLRASKSSAFGKSRSSPAIVRKLLEQRLAEAFELWPPARGEPPLHQRSADYLDSKAKTAGTVLLAATKRLPPKRSTTQLDGVDVSEERYALDVTWGGAVKAVRNGAIDDVSAVLLQWDATLPVPRRASLIAEESHVAPPPKRGGPQRTYAVKLRSTIDADDVPRRLPE